MYILYGQFLLSKFASRWALIASRLILHPGRRHLFGQPWSEDYERPSKRRLIVSYGNGWCIESVEWLNGIWLAFVFRRTRPIDFLHLLYDWREGRCERAKDFGICIKLPQTAVLLYYTGGMIYLLYLRSNLFHFDRSWQRHGWCATLITKTFALAARAASFWLRSVSSG